MNLTKMQAQHERTETARDQRKPTEIVSIVPESLVLDTTAWFHYLRTQGNQVRGGYPARFAVTDLPLGGVQVRVMSRTQPADTLRKP